MAAWVSLKWLVNHSNIYYPIRDDISIIKNCFYKISKTLIRYFSNVPKNLDNQILNSLASYYNVVRSIKWLSLFISG